MSTARHRSRSARLLVRQVNELLLARWLRWQALIPQERFASLVVETVLSASIAHLAARDPASGAWRGIDAACDLGRPVNANAIAVSMVVPQTTIRRRAVELVAAGLLVRDSAGFRVAPGFFAGGRLADVAAADRADLIRVMSALAEADYEPAATALAHGVGDLPAVVVSRHLQGYALRALERFAALHGDFTIGTIFSVIVTANVHHVTQDPELARRYADEDAIPPDDVRRPIALRQLSRALNMPFETLRRRVNTMIADGIVEQRDGGVIIPARELQHVRIIDNNRRMNRQFEQMIATLIALSADSVPR